MIKLKCCDQNEKKSKYRGLKVHERLATWKIPTPPKKKKNKQTRHTRSYSNISILDCIIT